jgi:hypothetical protein
LVESKPFYASFACTNSAQAAPFIGKLADE